MNSTKNLLTQASMLAAALSHVDAIRDGSGNQLRCIMEDARNDDLPTDVVANLQSCYRCIRCLEAASMNIRADLKATIALLQSVLDK